MFLSIPSGHGKTLRGRLLPVTDEHVIITVLHGTVLRKGIVPAHLQNCPRPEESFSYWWAPWAQLWNSENVSLHCPLVIS